MTASLLDHVNLDEYALPGSGLEKQESIIPEKKHWKVNGQLTQLDKKNKKKLIYTRFNSHFLSFKQISKTNTKEIVIDLAYLHKKCVEKKQQSTALLISAVLALLVTGIVVALVPTNPLYLVIPIGLCILLAALSLKSRTHVYRFYTLAGKIPVLEFSAASPNKQAVTAFLNEIIDNIAKAKKNLPSGKDLIPAVVIEMRRLAKTGLINQKQYDRVKRVLFNS